MEIFIVAFLVSALILILKQVSVRIKINEDIEKYALTIEQATKLYTEEINRRKNEINEIEKFLDKALFFKPFAILSGETIFKYISNDTRLYEFEDFVSEKNQRIVLDENVLCFKKCVYKRVKEIEKLTTLLQEIKENNIKAESQIKYDLSSYSVI